MINEKLKVKEIYLPIVNKILMLKKEGNLNNLITFINNMSEEEYGYTLAIYYVGMIGLEENETLEDYLRISLKNIINIKREHSKFFETSYEALEEYLNRGIIIFSQN